MCSTKPVFFDTDCLSAFLWVDKESILTELYPHRIVIPIQVHRELSYPKLNKVKELIAQVDALVSKGMARMQCIDLGSPEYKTFYMLTQHPDPGQRIIGDGEAAAIALALQYHGILASNNLRDVSLYVDRFKIGHLTTGAIMKEALEARCLTEEDGNLIWGRMLERKRRLGYPSFTDYLEDNK